MDGDTVFIIVIGAIIAFMLFIAFTDDSDELNQAFTIECATAGGTAILDTDPFGDICVNVGDFILVENGPEGE